MRYIKILFVLSFLFFADEENLKNKIAKILPQDYQLILLKLLCCQIFM